MSAFDSSSFGKPQQRLEPESYHELTFSMPQNLSLPSLRRGPAFSSMRSNGVGWGAFGSFLDFAGELLLEFRPSCFVNCQIVSNVSHGLSSQKAAGRTVLLLSLPKNEDIVYALHLQLADDSRTGWVIPSLCLHSNLPVYCGISHRPDGVMLEELLVVEGVCKGEQLWRGRW